MELNYKQFGQGEPLIILHGLFGTLDNWQGIAKILAEKYTVFAIDQRNHGKSPHADEFSYSILAEDLREFMDARHIAKAHLLGHSMGGKTVMTFALEYPDRVNDLIVVDIAPKAYTGGHQTIFEAMFSVDFDTMTERGAVEEQLKKLIPEDSVRLFLMKNITREQNRLRWKMNLPVLYQHYDKILEGIESDNIFEKRTLFVRGEYSNYIRNEDILLIQEFFPHAEVQTIDKAGHWVHAENPTDFLNVVSNFLDKKS